MNTVIFCRLRFFKTFQRTKLKVNVDRIERNPELDTTVDVK